MIEDYDLTIAIPTKDRYVLLNNLLNSLNNQKFKQFYIIIIDASDNYNTIKKNFPHLNIKQYKFMHPNLPLQRWESIKRSATKYIGFLDDDITLPDNYLKEIMKYLILPDKKIGGVCGWLENVPNIKKVNLYL